MITGEVKRRILIYDDEEDILEVTKLILSKDYEVFTKNCISDPVEEVLEVEPDLILIDIWIPTCGGEEAVRALKKVKETAGIPILLFSANTQLKAISEDLDVYGYVNKPFDIATLKAKISDTLKAH